jgi:hypothetical protein
MGVVPFDWGLSLFLEDHAHVVQGGDEPYDLVIRNTEMNTIAGTTASCDSPTAFNPLAAVAGGSWVV